MKWWLLDRVPRRMRTWPILRRYYWQQEELDRAKAEAAEMFEFFGWGDDDSRS